MDAQVICGYCEDEIPDGSLADHLPSCPEQPWWYRRVGLEREGWDTPPEAA